MEVKQQGHGKLNSYKESLSLAIVEVAAYARKKRFRYSRLCGDAFDAADAVR